MFDPEKLVAQLTAVRAAPAPFIVALLAMALIIYLVIDARYSGIIANRYAELSLVKGQRDAYRDKLNGASPDEAKNRMDSLERQVAALAKHIDPRSIKADQERVLAAALTISDRSMPTISVAADVACTDCSIYAHDLARILHDAGWEVTVGIVMGTPIRSAVGLDLAVSDPAKLDPNEATILNGLKSAGVQFTLSGGAVRTPGLTVGPLLPR